MESIERPATVPIGVDNDGATAAPPLLGYSAPGHVPAEWIPTLKVYRLDPERTGELRTRLHKFILVDGLVRGTAVFAACYLVWAHVFGNASLLVTAGLGVGGAIAVGIQRWIGRKSYASYMLYVSDLGVARKITGYPDIFIPRESVIKVLETKRGLFIRGRQLSTALLIPAQLENFSSVRQQLNEWKAVNRMRAPALRIAAVYLVSALVLGLFATAWISTNAVYFVSGGILLAIFLVWNAIRLQRNPHVSWNRKIFIWVWILIMVSVLVAGGIFRLSLPRLLGRPATIPAPSL